MTVAQISTLRRQLRTLDADYKVFKNTLVRRAIAGTPVEPLEEFLEGPTAIAFVERGRLGGRQGPARLREGDARRSS